MKTISRNIYSLQEAYDNTVSFATDDNNGDPLFTTAETLYTEENNAESMMNIIAKYGYFRETTPEEKFVFDLDGSPSYIYEY